MKHYAEPVPGRSESCATLRAQPCYYPFECRKNHVIDYGDFAITCYLPDGHAALMHLEHTRQPPHGTPEDVYDDGLPVPDLNVESVLVWCAENPEYDLVRWRPERLKQDELRVLQHEQPVVTICLSAGTKRLKRRRYRHGDIVSKGPSE